MDLDQMVSALFDCVALAPQERYFVRRMVNVCGPYTQSEATEIRRLHKLHFGRLEKIKGQKIDDPPAGPGLED